MAVIYTPHFMQFFDDNGNPLSNGKLYTYAASTTTPKATFTTAVGDVENANPIELDAAGRATLFISGAYRFDLFDVNDNLIDSTDDITAFNTTGVESDAFFQAFSGTGSQTAFTLSQDLGTDEKGLNIFIDDSGWSPIDPSDYTVDGTSLTFDTAPASGTDNIYVYSPTQSFGAAASAAAEAQASEAAALTAKNEAEAAAGLLDISSTTSLLIETGTKVFTVSGGLGLTAGQFVLAVSDADVSNFMFGQITSYSGTSLTVDVQVIGGSGTFADWTITLIGLRGIQGATGSISDISGVPIATPTLTDTAIFTDVSDSNTTKKATIGAILDLASGGGWVPIQTQTVSSAVASVDFTTGIDSTYKAYAVKLDNVSGSVDGQEFWLRLGNGGSFDTGSTDYDYTTRVFFVSSVFTLNTTGGSQIKLSRETGNAAGEHISGNVFLSDPSSSNFTKIDFFGGDINNASESSILLSSGYRKELAAHDRIQFLFASGNITAGTFTLYGLAGA